MKAFVMKEIGRVGLMDKPVPRAGPGDAVVRATRGLICTSDTHTVMGGIGPRENLTLGHEAVGVVHEVGGEVRDFRPGDRVLVGAITPDWGDVASQNGHPSQSGGPLGGWKFANVKDGVFAEYFHVNEADANMAKIPDDVSDDAAVYCADMLSTGFMGAEHGDIPIGGTVTGYFGEGEFVRIPRVEWGVGMADKTVATGLCPGGRLRMERLLRLLQARRLDPTHMTSHRFGFDEIERAFEVMDRKLEDVIKPLIIF
jgi:threonine dehydrogenase-like Zn-dependent dehydrogenase